jgi:hypothetical protein
MSTQEQQFTKLEEETNNNNSSPLWIKQSEYYRNNNKLLKYNKKIYSIDLIVYSDGRIFYANKEDLEIPQHDNNKGYKMVNINNKAIYVHHLVAWTYLYKDIKEFNNAYPDEKYEINHRDNNNKNNNVNNLIICNIELNRLNKRKYKGKCKNNYKGVYKVLVNNKDFEINKDENCDITKDGIIYKIVFKGKFVDYKEDEKEAANIYDKMLISYIVNKYGSLSLINDNVLNNNNNLDLFKNEFIQNTIENF